MIKQAVTLNEKADSMRMNPKKFNLWLFLGTTFMLFAAMTSAVIVKMGDGNWLEYELPAVLNYSTAVILLSSATLHWGYFAAKKDRLDQVKLATVLTLVLGLIFLWLQYSSWTEMVAQSVHFVGPPAGSFFYVLTGLHGAHLVSGIIFLMFVVVSAFRLNIHAKRLDQMEMCLTYWHFLDILWVYLYFFLLFYK